MGKPQLARLKQIFPGLQVGAVLGNRILVVEIEPYTEADRLEGLAKRGERGGIWTPEDAKEQNTPIATTGVVIQISEEFRGNRDVVAEGKVVMFGPYAGENVKFSDGCQLRVLDEAMILCTVVSNSENLLASILAPTIKEKLGIDLLKDAA